MMAATVGMAIGQNSDVTTEAADVVVLPEAIDLPTLFEDSHLWIVDKPAGMVVHPGPGHPSGTVLNALLGRLQAPVVLTEPTVDRAATGRARPNALAGSGDSLGVVARALFHRLTRRMHHNSAFSVVGAQFPAHALSVTGNIEMRNLVQP